MPSRPSSVGGYVPILPRILPPLVRRPTARRRHFCARFQQGRGEAKTQDRRKGHLQARHGVLYPCGYPYIPAPQNGPQKPPEARAGHKATPARSTRSKPGYYHLLRARESTAQRSAVWSYQAQYLPRHFTTSIASLRPISWTSCVHWPDSIKGHSRLSLKSSAIVVSPPESRWHSCLHPSQNHSRIVPARMIVVTPPPPQTRRSVLQAAFGL